MNDKFLHSDNLEAEKPVFFADGEFTWEKSSESIWDGKFAKLEDVQVKPISLIRKISYGIAASFILLVGFGSFAWFYAKMLQIPAGKHFIAELPDGSSVEMNAESSLKYYPYRWHFTRNVIFEGEGFFEVQKGKKFTVKSDLGKTVVLGTSFNIYSRSDLYKVACITGKVQVTSSNKESVILNPNQQVVIQKGNEIIKKQVVEPKELIMWRNNKFLFKATPIKDVVNEISRQYGVKIQLDANIYEEFSGSFNRQSNVEEVLTIVCKPFNYDFIKQKENSYLIVRKD